MSRCTRIPIHAVFAVAGLGALLLTLVTLIVLSGLASLDLSLGGDDRPAPAASAPALTGPPTWLDHPLASPIDDLRALPPVRP